MVLLPRLRRALWLLCFAPCLGSLCAPGQAQLLDNGVTQKFQSRISGLTTQRQAETLVEQGLPNQLQLSEIADLPVDTAALPDHLGLQVTPKPYLPTQAIEPQHSGVFPRITYFYVPTQTAGTEQLLCRLHFTEMGDSSLATRMGGLLTLLHQTLTERLGRPPFGGTSPFDVWLCRQGPAGDDEWHRNIYFYDLDVPRSSIEWVREIAHEYSHMALPPIGGYTAPEYWANGYYGERLLVRWLARTPSDPALIQQIWGDFSGWPNFERLLITPAIAVYKAHERDPAFAARTDETGMRYLIGQMLVFDDKYGSKRLANALSDLPHAREAHGPDFGIACAQALSAHGMQTP